MLIQPSYVHNPCKKLSQLEKVICRTREAIAETDFQAQFLKEKTDEKLFELEKKFQNEISKKQKDIESMGSEAVKTYEILYNSKIDNEKKNFSSDIIQICNHTNNVAKDIEAKLQQISKEITNLMQNFENQKNESEKIFENFQGDVVKKLEEKKKSHSDEISNIISETDQKIEKYKEDFEVLKLKLQQKYEKMSEDRPQTAIENQRSRRRLPKEVTDKVSKVIHDFSEWKQKANNMQIMHESDLKALREKAKSLVTQMKEIDESNKALYEKAQKDLQNENELFTSQRDQLQEKRNKIDEEYRAKENELYAKQAQLTKTIREQTETLKKGGMEKSESAEMFLSNQATINEQEYTKLQEKFQKKEEKQAKIIQELELQKDELLKQNEEEKKTKQIELEEITKKKADDIAERKNNFEKEMKSENKQYQKAVTQMNHRFDAVKIKNAQIVPAAKTLSSHQDELNILKSANQKQIAALDSAYEAKEHELKNENEQLLKQESDKLEEKFKQKQKENEEFLKQREEEIQVYLEKYKLNLNIENKVDYDLYKKRNNFDDFDFSSYEATLKKLQEELDSYDMSKNDNQSVDDDGLTQVLHDKEAAIEKAKQEKETIINQKQEIYNVEMNRKNQLDEQYEKKQKEIQDRKKFIQKQHQAKMNEYKTTLSDLSSQLVKLKKIMIMKINPLDKEGAIHDLRDQLSLTRTKSEEYFSSKDLLLTENINKILNEIVEQKKKNRKMLDEEDSRWEESHKQFKAKLDGLLKRRDDMRASINNSYQQMETKCKELIEKKRKENEEKLQELKNELQNQINQNTEEPEQKNITFERRKQTLEQRNERLKQQWDQELNDLKQQRKRAVDDISLSASIATQKLEQAKNRYENKPLLPEEQQVIKGLEEHLDELNQNLIYIGRSMLAYHDCLGIRESSYNKRFSQIHRPKTTLKGSGRLYPLPPLLDSTI